MMVERKENVVSLTPEYKLYRNNKEGFATIGQTVKAKQNLFNISETLPRDCNPNKQPV